MKTLIKLAISIVMAIVAGVVVLFTLRKKCCRCHRNFCILWSHNYCELYNQAARMLDRPTKVGFVCKNCAKKAATATCEVCKHDVECYTDGLEFIDDCNHAGLYNRASEVLGTGWGTCRFVCKNCAKRAATVKCASCKNDIHFYSESLKFNDDLVVAQKSGIEELGHQIARERRLFGLPDRPFKFENTLAICKNCSTSALQESRFLAHVEFLDCLGKKYSGIHQPVRLRSDVTSGESRCARCGTVVLKDDNYIAQLQALHNPPDPNSGFISDYLHSKAICPSCCWQLRPEHVNSADVLAEIGQDISDQPVNLFVDVPDDASHCRRCGKTISAERNFIGQLHSIYKDDPSATALRKVVQPFLDSSCICINCLYHLSPRQVAKDINYRLSSGWFGIERKAYIRGTQVEREFVPISCDVELKFPEEWAEDPPTKEELDGLLRNVPPNFCDSPDAVKDFLKKEAVAMGANGLVSFKWEKHSTHITFYRNKSYDWKGSRNLVYFTGTAVPVLLRHQEGEILRSGTKIIIDGSNMVLDERGSIKGLRSCLDVLRLKGYKPFIFIDANLPYKVDQRDRQMLEDLMIRFQDCITKVPARSRADPFILELANHDKDAHILSNDMYRQYVKRYSWLTEGHRVHKFMFLDGRIMIPDLGIDEQITGECK